ncbi:MAG: hypothetical protein ABI619_03500 [Betaproteobacteria bacterium]
MSRTSNQNRRMLKRSSSLWPRLVALAGAAVPTLVLAAIITGTPGPDFLEGTQEADTIDGLGGADTMMGLHGNDLYIVDQTDDQVIEAAGDGTDSVRSTVSYTLPSNVENLRLSGSAVINALGNGLNNRLTGNEANNTLSGRAGADRMFGSGGDDTYIVDSAGDSVNETLDDGIDEVRSSISYTLPSHVERLVLSGTGATRGTGNELGNVMSGNRGNNTLNGMAGNDTLNGAVGNDVLIGGPGTDRLTGATGQDSFQFDAPLDALTNVDRILDFSSADDVILLIGAVFPALTVAGTLPASEFALGIAAADADDRIIYDPATGSVRYDADGTGPAVAVSFVRLTTLPAVTNADFTVVDPVVTLVNFTADIQPIFSGACVACHSGASPPQGLRLDTGNSYANLVNVASKEVPSLKRVKPGDPDNSYIVQKIEGTAAVGGRMPLGRPALPAERKALIRRWISEGAND